MSINRPILAAVTGFCLGTMPCLAQENSVYISQVNQGSPLPNARLSTSPEAYSRVLGNASIPKGGAPSAAPGNFGTDLTTPMMTTGTVSNAVNAAGLSGNGAGNLTNNVAVINQFGTGNTGTIDQGGFNNRATAMVTGNSNVTSQTQSGGNSNSSTIAATGDNNQLTSTQVGSGNSFYIDARTNGYAIDYQQRGSGLSFGIEVTSANNSGKLITVTQTGTGSGRNVTPSTLPSGAISGISTAR